MIRVRCSSRHRLTHFRALAKRARRLAAWIPRAEISILARASLRVSRANCGGERALAIPTRSPERETPRIPSSATATRPNFPKADPRTFAAGDGCGVTVRGARGDFALGDVPLP